MSPAGTVTRLTPGDREFIQARRSYLSEEQRIKFGIEDAASSGDAAEAVKSVPPARKARQSKAE
jgi:hypothetical protein